MSPTGLIIILSISCLLATLTTCQQDANSGIVNKKVDRTIDITSQLVKITCRIQIENTGQKPITSYSVVLEDPERLAAVTASIAKSGAEKGRASLAITKKQSTGANEVWTVDLGSEDTVSPGSVSPTLDIEAVYTHSLTPHPTEILQSEKQLVLLNNNHYFYSPYLTKTQTTKVRIPSGSSVESYSKLKPTAQSDSVITYGPYENVPENSVSKLTIHYENNSPFLTVTRLERAIEISHWAGVVSVEEDVDIRHTGALLKGPFSRYEFQREPTNGMSAVKNLKTKLPSTAYDIYYRDEIGNISTSNIRKVSSHLLADLRPRFPLFGGWKTHYILGYSLPASDYLLNDGNQYILRIPFVGHIYDNMVVDDATIRVILPEGASDIRLRLPFSINREKDEIRKTYLDTVGRTVVVLRKRNLIENHIQDFEVHYTFNRIYMLQEPLLIILALFIICFTFCIYNNYLASANGSWQTVTAAVAAVKTGAGDRLSVGQSKNQRKSQGSNR